MEDEILSYEKREELKTAGWKKFSSGKTAGEKCAGLLMVIDAHYWRQREIFSCDKLVKRHTKLAVGRKYYPGYILDIDHYTPHWLHAMRDIISEEVMQCMDEQWGYIPKKSDYLPDGCSIYRFEDNVR